MQILFCHACGVRIVEPVPPGTPEHEMFCAGCAAKRQTAAPTQPSSGVRPRQSERPGALPTGRRAAKEASRPRPGAESRAGLIVCAAGVALLLLGLALVFGGNKERTARSAQGPAPAEESKRDAAAPEPPQVEHRERVAPPQLAPSRPAKPNPSAEDLARDAFELLERFEGLAPDDTAGRLARIDAFLARHGDTIVAARARRLAGELSKPLPENPPPAQTADMPLPAPVTEPETQPPAPRTSGHLVIGSDFEAGVQGSEGTGMVEANGPPGSRGKVLRLTGKENGIKGGLFAWMYPQGTPQRQNKVLFVTPEGGRVRFRYFSPNAEGGKIVCEESGTEKPFQLEFAVRKGEWTQVDVPLGDLKVKDKPLAAGSKILELYVRLYGSKVEGFIDDLEVTSPVAEATVRPSAVAFGP
ncbi:MAG: hypothetical protein M5U26_24260 [Planctomycetota bacterium]|nr:hypothetical protein [Planctomycetota bacterium]